MNKRIKILVVSALALALLGAIIFSPFFIGYFVKSLGLDLHPITASAWKVIKIDSHPIIAFIWKIGGIAVLFGAFLYLIYFYWAPENLFFTFVKEGTSKFVVKGGEFWK